MLHGLILAAQNNPEAAGFIVKGIKGVLVAIGSIIAAIVCAVIAGVKGRNPFGWGILGLFFSILTLIVIAIIPTKKKNQSSGEASRTDNPSGIDVGSLQGDARQVHPETAADSLAMLDERRVNLSHSRTRTSTSCTRCCVS